LKFDNRIRAGVVILVAALALFAPAALADTDPPLNRFEGEIQAFEAKDKSNPPPPGQILFIGSSTFVHWKTLKHDLSDLHPLNRGFGGSTIPEINYYEKRVVAPYKPSKIVFYAGTNDIAEGHKSAAVCADFVRFVEAVQKDAPAAQIYFVAISVAPSRLSFQKQFDQSNDLIRKYVKTNPKLHFVDVCPVMLDEQKHLKGEYFGPDQLHMTPAGYAAWTPIIRKALTSP
jgi:lysophospholipase L1-like esterase